jgi:hypothetical protein
LEEVGDNVTESSLVAKEWEVARASIAPPALGERRHRKRMRLIEWQSVEALGLRWDVVAVQYFLN